MKQSVSLPLFGLVILTISSMALMAVYYKNTYEDLNSRYQNSKEEIEAKAMELNTTLYEVREKEELLGKKENILSDYMSELNLSKERESSLGEHFVDLQRKNEYLGDKLNKTLIDRDRYKTNYETSQREYNVLRVDYELKKTESQERMSEILRVRSLKPSFYANIQRLRDRNSGINTNKDRIADKADEIKKLAEGITNATIKNQMIAMANDVKSKTNLIDDILDEMLQDIDSVEDLTDRI